MPCFSSSRLRRFGGRSPNKARWISSKLYCPVRRTTILSPSCSHSKIEPGCIPSFRPTSTGTEICPCDVPLDRAIVMLQYSHGNAWLFEGARQDSPLQRRIHAVVEREQDRKSTRLNSSHLGISYAVFCLK